MLNGRSSERVLPRGVAEQNAGEEGSFSQKETYTWDRTQGAPRGFLAGWSRGEASHNSIATTWRCLFIPIVLFGV